MPEFIFRKTSELDEDDIGGSGVVPWQGANQISG